VSAGELSPGATLANSDPRVSSGRSMNILLLGSGGREDALAWRLRQSPSCDRLLAAPGNPGIARWAECVAIDPCDAQAVVRIAQEHGIDLVVIGPEAPLVAGVADALRDNGIAAFGPSAAAAQLEGSKGFTKDLCRANGIPTADYVRVDRREDAHPALGQFGLPVVIKADGLAAGKGVTIATTREEAEAAIEDATGPLVIEEFLVGEEASLFALVDGETAVPLASAQDHKRVGEGDTGPNTGGMGAYAPAPVLTSELEQRAMDEIVRPTARALAAAGTPFSGVLYAGLMLTSEGPKLIEYNVRFGDPECEAIMPLIEGDFAELLHSVATGRLAEIDRPELAPKHAMTVIVAARGYPGTPQSGGVIRAIEAAEQVEGVTVFHAGTALSDGGLVAKGGRVLAVTAVADTFANARARAYRAVDQIDFADGFYRRDIGWRELARENA
jgi:phosphoribosylamine---glycine ligase